MLLFVVTIGCYNIIEVWRKKGAGSGVMWRGSRVGIYMIFHLIFLTISIMLSTVSTFPLSRTIFSVNCRHRQWTKSMIYSTISTESSNNNSGGERKGENNIYKDRIIKLTSEEKYFFNTLMNVVREKKLNTTVRVAGGWVRDKLLASSSGQQHSNETTTDIKTGIDIDIAVDNITGVKFIERMNEWLTKNGSEAIKFTVIRQNPEKSKHLETGMMLFLILICIPSL